MNDLCTTRSSIDKLHTSERTNHSSFDAVADPTPRLRRMSPDFGNNIRKSSAWLREAQHFQESQNALCTIRPSIDSLHTSKRTNHSSFNAVADPTPRLRRVTPDFRNNIRRSSA